MLLMVCDNVANTPPGVGADSSRPYPNIIKNVYSRHQIRVSVSPHTHIHIINYVFSHHRTRISATLFVGEHGYAGTINRPLRLLTDCQNVANGLLIMQRTPTKYVANTPSGVGADSSRPCPNITRYTYSHYQIRVYTLPNMRIHITKYVYSRHQTRVFTLPNIHIHIIEYVYSIHRTRIFSLSNLCIIGIEFVFFCYQICAFISPHAHFRLPLRGCFRICGRDKSDPYGC